MRFPKLTGVSSGIAAVAIGLVVVGLDAALPLLARVVGGANASTSAAAPAPLLPPAPGLTDPDAGRHGVLVSLFGSTNSGAGSWRGCGTGPLSADAARMGDKVNVRIFQADDLGATGASVFERLDLSGVFEVEEAGTIGLPAIGRIDVAGQTLPCLESAMQERLTGMLAADVTVTATYAARMPVLVRGAVVAPGGYAYAPGLTVEAVLAQSGGDLNVGTAFEQMSLKARHKELLSLRSGLSLELAANESLLRGDDSLQLGPAGQGDAGQGDIEAHLGAQRVDSEQAALAAALRAELAHQAYDAAEVTDLENSITSAQIRQTAAEMQQAYFEQREAALNDMLNGECRDRCQEGRRAIQSQLDSVGLRLMDLELLVLEKTDVLERLIHAKRSRQSGALLSSAERQRDIALRLRDLTAEIDRLDAQILSVVIQSGTISVDGHAPRLTVLRAVDGVQQAFSAAFDTRLLPGDILSVDSPLSVASLTDPDKLDLVQASQ